MNMQADSRSNHVINNQVHAYLTDNRDPLIPSYCQYMGKEWLIKGQHTLLHTR